MTKHFAMALGAALSLAVLTGCPPADECKTNDECTGTQACVDGACVAGTCANGGVTCSGSQVCSVDRCVTCTATAGCTSPQVCNTGANGGLGACVQCIANAQCTGTPNPACNLDTNTCVICTDAYCAADPNRAVCDATLGCICGDNDHCTAAQECTANTNACQTIDVAAGSAGIQAFLAATAGVLTTPIAIPNVLVTYTRAAMVGGDPAGFFVQAEPTGPAMFVELDPATQTPAVAQGDRITFNATTKAIGAGVHKATAISGLTKVSETAHPVTSAPPKGLLQDISAATDVVSALDSYTSELVHISDAEIIANFFGAGTGYSAAEIDTAGLTPDETTGNTGLRLRLPTTVVNELDLVDGCVVTVTAAPMWRFNATAQVNPMTADEVTVASCPAPKVTSALALSATEVVVFFDRQLDASTVTASDFTSDGGLTVSAVAVTGKQVKLTTSTQTAGTAYTLTLGEIRDTLGSATTSTSVKFYGYSTVAAGAVVINEVDYDNVGTDNAEFIELYNKSGAPVFVDGLVVILVNGTGNVEYGRVSLASATALDGTATNVLPAGGYLVIAPGTFFTNNTLPAGTLKVLFSGTTDQVQNGAPDALGIVHYATGTMIDALSYEGTIGASTISTGAGDVSLTFKEGTTGNALVDGNSTVSSLGRNATSDDTDTNATDFALKTTLTPGAVNP